ncbi:MAG: hypothetical protein JSS75_07060 [Bacteroidetes bacterium]|nr:hypothetical protein [Bacteroidota bacterium]
MKSIRQLTDDEIQEIIDANMQTVAGYNLNGLENELNRRASDRLARENQEMTLWLIVATCISAFSAVVNVIIALTK